MKIYVTAVEALRKKIRQAETRFITKIGEKTTLGPSYFLFWKIFIPSYAFDALLCQNWLFVPATVNEHPPAQHPLDVRYYPVLDEPQLS
jgi:hypothetical protein